jgi:LysM repeat protein
MPQTPTPAATALPAAELSTTAIPSASASPTAGVTATMTVSPTPVVYTVAAGDTLLGIALEYGVTTGSLMRANELADEDRIYIGQELIIPAPTPDSSTPSAESTTTPAAIERSFVHVVQAGETLLAIAIKVGSTTDAIAEANGLESTDLIFVGQRLIIPETPQTPTPAPTSAGRSHVVQAGETLTWIARKYGVTIEALMEANDLTSADEIYAGQTLTIP